MDLRIAGKRVLITGASKGIGEGIAQAFAEEGCHLHLVARSGDKLEALAARLAAAHGIEATFQVADLTQTAGIEAVAREAGAVDVLVNNAGAIPGGDLWQVDGARWRAGWELKVFGYVDLTRAIYGAMKARSCDAGWGGGVILNNIGNGGEVFDPQYIAGATGNAGLMAFTRALGSKSLADNIRVVGVNPGPVATDRITTLMKTRAKALLGDEGRYPEIMARYPLGRPASVREVADLFVFLASPRSGYTSGVVFTVDGGISSAHS